MTSFQPTPLMSTYLVAFLVSDFLFKAKKDKDGFEHRVFVQPPEIENAKFGVEQGQLILSAISEYLNVNYSIPKMDQAAIPAFKAGGINFDIQQTTSIIAKGIFFRISNGKLGLGHIWRAIPAL